jgi:hypothetical protein
MVSVKFCDAASSGGGEHAKAMRHGGSMTTVPTNVGVFYGQVDNRATGWYWADTRSEKLRSFRGPFESKEQAVEDALRSLASDEPGERGAA